MNIVKDKRAVLDGILPSEAIKFDISLSPKSIAGLALALFVGITAALLTAALIRQALS